MTLLKWNLWALTFVVLVSCGGGGGGGGDSSPSNLEDNPEPELPQDLQTGIFTDAPVTGLRYEHGRITGYTDDGEFQYDANSSDPVCFYIGEVRLGCSVVGAIITPFDLSAPGQPAGLQSGYNITRLLNSLDVSDTPEISLSEETRRATGIITFAVSDAVFATDELVVDLVNRYAPEGVLLSREQASNLIADNADVQTAISNLNQVLNESVSGITIRWNGALTGPGVLAHIESESESGNKEHLYLEVGINRGSLFLQKTTYIDSDGKYVYITWGEDGNPKRVVRNGVVYGYFNFLKTRQEDWINTSTYQPQRTGYLVGNGGFSDKIETGYVSPQIADELELLVGNLGNQALSQASMLRIASHAMIVNQYVLCSGNAANECATQVSDALLNAQADSGYEDQVISWVPEFLETDLCLPAVDETSPRSCGFTPNLEEFTVVLSSRAQNFSGMVEPDWNFPPDDLPQDILDALSTFKIEMSKKFGGVEAVIRWWCEADRVIYEFSDDVFYLGDRGGSLDCSLERNSYNQIINCFVGGARNISNIAYCPSYGINSTADWPGYMSDRSLVMDVASKVRSGFGFILRDYGTTRYLAGDIAYVTEDEYAIFQSGQAYVRALFDESGRDLEKQSYYQTRADGFPFRAMINYDYSGDGVWYKGYFWAWVSNGYFRGPDGSELRIGFAHGNDF